MTKNLLYCVSLFILLFAVACSEDSPDPEVEKENVFSLALGENQSDQILLLSDEQGNVFRVDTLLSGTTHTYETEVDSLGATINVHLLSFGASRISSHLMVPKGAAWNIKDRPRFDRVGEAFVSVTNFPRPKIGQLFPNATNSKEDLAIIGGLQTFGQSDLQWDSVVFRMRLAQETDTLLIGNTNENGNARYIKINNVRPDDMLSFDFNEDFVPYETSLVYEHDGLGEVFSEVLGHKPGIEPQIISSRFGTQTTQDVTQLSYIDGYDYYTSFITVQSNFVLRKYFKVGEPVASSDIEFPTTAPEVQDNTYDNLTLANTSEYQWVTTAFSNNNVSIEVTAPVSFARQGLLNASTIPENLLNGNPQLFDGLTLSQIKLYNNLAGELHPERLPFLDAAFVDIAYTVYENSFF